MKALFVLQNLKPPLPRAYERDSSEKRENLRPLTLSRRGAGAGTGRRRQGRGWQSPARPPTPRGSRQRLLRSRSPFPPVRGLWRATIGFRFLLSRSLGVFSLASRVLRRESLGYKYGAPGLRRLCGVFLPLLVVPLGRSGSWEERVEMAPVMPVEQLPARDSPRCTARHTRPLQSPA